MSEPDSSTPKPPRGSGSVWQRKDGRWGVQWTEFNPETGTKITRCSTRNTEETARALLNDAPNRVGMARRMGGGVRKSDWGYDHLMDLTDSDTECVYFLQALQGGPIKIGATKLLKTRMMALQSGCPFLLQVLHVIEGAGRKEEAALHRRFSISRLHGEWFHAIGPLCDLIGALQTTGDDFRTQIDLACSGYYPKGKRVRTPQYRYLTKMKRGRA